MISLNENPMLVQADVYISAIFNRENKNVTFC